MRLERKHTTLYQLICTRTVLPEPAIKKKKMMMMMRYSMAMASRRLPSLLLQWATILTTILIVALISASKINCDQVLSDNNNITQVTHLTSTVATTTTEVATPTTIAASTTNQHRNSSSIAAEGATSASGVVDLDYRQRPNPAGSADSSAKIIYDTQHELAAATTTQAAPSSTAAAESELANRTDVTTQAAPAHAHHQVAAAKIGKKSWMDHSPDNIATGVALISDSNPMADYLAGQAGELDLTGGSLASALDHETLDLDAAGATNPSVLISRHGRASSGQQAPNQSRLSAYTPMLLQNSRSHASTSGSQLQPQMQTTTTARPNTPFDPIIVCYLGSWSVYRPSLAKFTPENINPYLCTHIIYAFAGLSSKYELKPFDTYNDITQGGYRKFTGLKDYNKQLKTLIAVGGWNEGSARFSKLVGSPELRANFIQSTVRYLREHKFDGIDLDWEYPSYRDGSSPDDKEKYATLIKELRVAFDKDKENHPNSQKLLLSVAVPAGQDNIDNGFDVPTISKNVDFMNVLTYDYYTAFDKQTNHHAPLSVRADQANDASAQRLNIDWTIQYYLSLGAAPNKLIVGVPTYGRSYTLSSGLPDGEPARLRGTEDAGELADRIGLGARADSPGDEGPATREKGYLAYYEICHKLDNEQWHRQRFASQHQGPVAFKGNQWVSYDDVESAVMKAEYVAKNRLGGVMIWTLDNDDFRGSCPSSRQQENPLITAIRDTIIKSVTGGVLPSQRPTTTTSTTTTTTTTSTTTTTTTPAPPPPPQPTETTPDGDGGNNNELAAASSSESTSASESSGSLIKSLASGARQAPTTPDPGPAFSCQDEGFYPNPKDCKKYFWCLDSGPANLGVVAHAFTCPSGLFFNSQTEGCDYPEKVSCKKSQKSSASTTTTSTSTTTTSTTTTTPRPSAQQQAAASSERNRMVVKKSRKPAATTSTTTSTTTTTTLPPATAAPTVAPTTLLPGGVPISNDINELVANMLQNPQFASVITSQLKLSQQQQQAGGAGATNGQRRPQQPDQLASELAEAAAAAAAADSSGNNTDANGQLEPNSKQAQELLQLLNLIQSLGGIEKIAPYLSNQAAGGGYQAGGETGAPDSQDLAASAGSGTRQRRPQPTDGGGAAETDGGDNSAPQEPFVFSYGQPSLGGGDQRFAASFSSNQDSSGSSNGGQYDSVAPSPQLTSEILQNLAQLESLFAYNQPGRGASSGVASGGQQPQDSNATEQPNALPNIESQPFTVDDAKFQPMLPMQPVPGQARQRESIIRVQVPGHTRHQQQHQQQRPAQRQQQQQQQQQHHHQQQQQLRSQQQHYNDINNYLPYLEGDVRQPVGQQRQALQQQQHQAAGGRQAGRQSSARQQQQQPIASGSRQQPQSTSLLALDEDGVSRQPQQRRAQQQHHQQQTASRGQTQAQQPQQQQHRRRPPNRERGQRLNTADFPLASATGSARQQDDRPRSLVLLAPGPPSAPTDGSPGGQPEYSTSGGETSTGDELTERQLEERLRLLESGYYPPPSAPSSNPATESSTTVASRQRADSAAANSFFFQDESIGAASSPTQSPLLTRPLQPEPGTQPTAAAAAAPISSTSRDAHESSPLESTSSTPAASLLDIVGDQNGPGASFDPQTGKLVCNRRGVFAHPNNCGQFIVCAPQSRSQRSLRPFEHHCPAEHIFHDSWGRCRPKSLQSDLGRFCQGSGSRGGHL